MQFYEMLYLTRHTLIYTTVLKRYKCLIGDLPVVGDNHKLLSKFHSGTLRIMDTMRLMSLFFLIIARTPARIRQQIAEINECLLK